MENDRNILLVVLVSFSLVFLVACGGDGSESTSSNGNSDSTKSVQNAEDGNTSAEDGNGEQAEEQTEEQSEVGEVHTVQMIGDKEGYYYEPAELTIQPGDKVVWEFVSGAPHDVNFNQEKYDWPQVPEGAYDLLESKGKLAGKELNVMGQSYEIHFTEEYPTGTYKYVCTPHIASGMRGQLHIEPAE